LSYAIKAVDCTLQDIRSNHWPFGGITIVFGGDFQQTLPIIPKGTKEDILLATIQQSYLWQHVSLLQLRVNMCVDNNPSSLQFVHWLLNIGHGNSNPASDLNQYWK
jgi:hypothetical protein